MIDIFKEKDNSVSLALENFSKASLKTMANEVVHSVMEGHEDALSQYIKAKGLAEIASNIIDGLKEQAVIEADKYSQGEKLLGCTFQVKATPTLYDFTNNQEWVELNEQITKLKETQKEIEREMIVAMGYSEMVNKDGVIVPMAIIKKASTSTLSILIPS